MTLITPLEGLPVDNSLKGAQPEMSSFIPSDPPSITHPANLDINDVMIRTTRMLSILRPKLEFAPAYPDFVTNFEGKTDPYPTAPDETITWKVTQREPGALNGTPFSGGNREVATRVRQQTLDPKKDWQSLDKTEIIHEYHGKVMDNIVQFDCWSKTNRQSVQLLEWFENFMHEFSRLFLEMGVKKTYFWDRTDDSNLFQYRNGLIFRSTRYYFRTEKIYAIRLHLIEEIRHRLAVLGSNEVVSQVIN